MKYFFISVLFATLVVNYSFGGTLEDYKLKVPEFSSSQIYSVLSNDVWDFFPLYKYDTALKKKHYEKSSDFKIQKEMLPKLAKLVKKQRYSVSFDAKLSNYNLKRGVFFLFFGKNMGQISKDNQCPKTVKGFNFENMPIEFKRDPSTAQLFGIRETNEVYLVESLLPIKIPESKALPIEENLKSYTAHLSFNITGYKKCEYPFFNILSMDWYRMKQRIVLARNIDFELREKASNKVVFKKSY